MQIPEPAELKRWYEQHVNRGMLGALAFLGMDTAEVWAEGWTVRTADGREFIDCLGGFGAYNFGHRHPAIVAAVKAQLDQMPMSSRLALNPVQARLAHDLAALAPGDLQYSFFCNSGTEAVEAALKLARLNTGKPGIISATNAYHGKTYGSLSSTHREHFQRPFRPLLEHFVKVPYGDIAALEQALTDEVAAVMFEPVQGEGGINVAPAGYLPAVRELTRARGVLFILDEVQTGLGRTGWNFACEREGVVPDILTLAKSLGGGVMPLGAAMGTPAVWAPWNEQPTIHTSTFGGNQLACAAGIAALQVLVEERLAQKARLAGEHFLGGLRQLQLEFPALIKDARGLGLMLGLEMASADVGQLFIANVLHEGVLVAYTLNQLNVLRIEPPLIMPLTVIDDALSRMRTALTGTQQILEQFGLAGT